MARERSQFGRAYDPVFLFMVVAVVLAVGTSIALRCMSSGLGPQSAQAAESELSAPTPTAFLQPLPTPKPVDKVADKAPAK